MATDDHSPEELEALALRVESFMTRSEDEDFDPFDTKEDMETMLNIAMVMTNQSVARFNPFDIFRLLYMAKIDPIIRRITKKEHELSRKNLKMTISLLMGATGRTEYIVPLLWHDIMLDLVKEHPELFEKFKG